MTQPFPSPNPSASPRVLVIDDDTRVLSAFRAILRHLRRECDLLPSSKELEAHLRSHDYANVFVDVHLGRGDDVTTVLSTIERVAPSLLHRTRLATGDPMGERANLLRARFRVGLLEKPFGIDSVRAALEGASEVA